MRSSGYGPIPCADALHLGPDWADTQPFQYGTVEVRAKLPGGTGAWPVIWMLGYQWQTSQPYTAMIRLTCGLRQAGGEIDIAEFLSNSRTQVNCTAHVGSSDGSQLQNLPFDATSRFMVYRLQWTSSSLIYSVDPEDGGGYQPCGP